MRAERLRCNCYGCNLAVHYVGPSMEMIEAFHWLILKEEYVCTAFRLNSY